MTQIEASEKYVRLCQKRLLELDKIIRNAINGCNAVGQPIMKSSARSAITSARRDKQLVEAIKEILQGFVMDLSTEAEHGLQRLLVPVRRHLPDEQGI